MKREFQELIKCNVNIGQLNKSSLKNSKMEFYIYIYHIHSYLFQFNKIIFKLKKALNIIYNISKVKGLFMFIEGEGKLNKKIIRHTAKMSKSLVITSRWLGGSISNWVRYLITKKTDKFKGKLINQLPTLVLLFNNTSVEIIQECLDSRLPIISFCNIYTDPKRIDYIVPGESNSISTVYLYNYLIYRAIKRGETFKSFKNIRYKVKFMNSRKKSYLKLKIVIKYYKVYKLMENKKRHRLFNYVLKDGKYLLSKNIISSFSLPKTKKDKFKFKKARFIRLNPII